MDGGQDKSGGSQFAPYHRTQALVAPVSIEKSADLEMNSREDFQNFLCLWAAALKQI